MYGLLDTYRYYLTFYRLVRVIYPLLQSLKYLKNKDSEGINVVLRYWCLNWVFSSFELLLPLLFNRYKYIFTLLSIVSYIITLSLIFFLIYDKFKGSNVLFDYILMPLMRKY